MTKTTKRSNAEIADSCISASEDWAAARSNQTLSEILHEAAAALRAPTIAALEPLQLTESEAAELDAFRAKPSRAEGLTFTPVPTIAAPSPSNEVTPEMVEAGFVAQCEEFPEFGNENRENMMRVARVAIEAALKARKPSPSQADDVRQVTGDDAALVARLRSLYCTADDCDFAADRIEVLSAEVLEKRTQAANEIIAGHELRQKLRSAAPRQVTKEALYAALDSWDGEKATFYNPDAPRVKRMRAALEAAIAVHNKEREG